jgi:hypothetical protein
MKNFDLGNEVKPFNVELEYHTLGGEYVWFRQGTKKDKENAKGRTEEKEERCVH